VSLDAGDRITTCVVCWGPPSRWLVTGGAWARAASAYFASGLFLWVLDLNCNGRLFDGTGAGQIRLRFGGISGDVPVIGALRVPRLVAWSVLFAPVAYSRVPRSTGAR